MDVKIKALPVKMSKEEALKIAAGHKNPVVKAMARGKKINLRIMYLENRYNIYEMTYHASPLAKLFKGESIEEQKQKIRIIVDTTTCSASYTSDPLYFEEIEVDEDSLQASYYDDQRLEDTGAFLAKRMTRRRIGKQISIELLSSEVFYRPYYIAIYGEMIEGTKARYLPIAADGHEVNTTI